MPDTETGAIFPRSGLDVTCEYGRQPADTAAAAANVRAAETLSDRLRGGSRGGLSRYIDAMVNGDSVIQHLAVLVDPQQPGLRQDPDRTYPDPSTNNLRTRVPPGRRLRLGGSAVWPIGNDDPPDQDDTKPRSVQFATGGRSSSTVDPLEVTFTTQPATNSRLFVMVGSRTLGPPGGDPATANTFTVATLDGRVFSQIGSGNVGYEFPTQQDRNLCLALFQIVSTGSVSDKTVRITPSIAGTLVVTIVELRGANAITPFGPSQSATATATVEVGSVFFVPDPITTIGPGTITVDGPGQLVLVTIITEAISGPVVTAGTPANFTEIGSGVNVYGRSNQSTSQTPVFGFDAFYQVYAAVTIGIAVRY